ncbi:MAG: Crp/Fnr family transcriptional regulator [Eubacterium sp.]|nr:Crp/Fnr family transcriptional regulator [Eubacterium sp.]
MDKKQIISQMMDMAKKYKLEISPATLEKTVHMSVFCVAEKGERLRRIGDETKSAGLVLNGIARCFYIDGNGNDITRGFSIAGTLCMDEGMFGYTESLTEWEALEETTIMVFSVEQIKKLIFEDDTLKNAYMTLLENALRYKIYRENGFLVENATERYIHFRKLYPEICSSIKQQYIATYLGIAPESLSRIRKNMKETENDLNSDLYE